MIILDTPFVRIPTPENRTEAANALAIRLNSLSMADREEYFALPANPLQLPPEDKRSVMDIALNIFEFNALTAGQNATGVYRNAAKIAHSCLPNSDYCA
jgi:hypothetical protein